MGISAHKSDFDRAYIMEDIAKTLPLSKIERPGWDDEILKNIGFRDVEIDREIYKRIWDSESQIKFSATPLFLISAEK